jgi:Ca2+-binding EF-hand superfamily protein
MFDRLDKEKKGFISMKNLQDLMRDDKTYFQGKDASHIMQKYGTDEQMSFEEFQAWWGSTYTTYEDQNLGRIVDEVTQEFTAMEAIPELPDNAPPHNSNVAVSRS